MYQNIALTLGLSRDYANDWDADTTADVERIWRMGVRKFLAAHDWRHLEERYTFVIPAAQESSTITVVDGVATIAAGTWPSWAANALLLPDGGNVYEVNTRDSDTQLTLYDTTLDLDAGTEYELVQVQFDLPSNFARVLEPFTIENVRAGELEEIPILPEWTLRGVGTRITPRQDRPEAFTTFQTVDESTNTFTPFVRVWPIPDQAYTVTGVIGTQIEDTLDQTASTVICNPVFSELLQEAILSAAEQLYLHGASMIHTQNFQAMLPLFIQKDRMLRGVRTLRPRRDDRQLPRQSRFIDSQGWTAADQFPFT